MHTQIAKLKRAAIFLAGISTASIPAMVHADWSIMGLGTLGGNYSYAYDISDSGQVVGNSINRFGYSHAFITGPNGVGMTDLGTLLGGSFSYASGINNSGQVVGSSDNSYSPNHAFITGPNGVGMIDLGSLGGSGSAALGINESGQVVGLSLTTYNSSFDAFITGPNGVGMIDLGTLGGNDGRASDVNDSGEAVGLAEIATEEDHSFIFSHGGITDLSLLTPVVAAGWTDLNVFSINNNGQIVGSGHRNGYTEAFFLSYTPDTVFDPKPIYIPPVMPEPETYMMLLGGLGLIGFLARRRKEAVI